MRNMVLIGVHNNYIVEKNKEKHRNGKSEEDTGPIKMLYF